MECIYVQSELIPFRFDEIVLVARYQQTWRCCCSRTCPRVLRVPFLLRRVVVAAPVSAGRRESMGACDMRKRIEPLRLRITNVLPSITFVLGLFAKTLLSRTPLCTTSSYRCVDEARHMFGAWCYDGPRVSARPSSVPSFGIVHRHLALTSSLENCDVSRDISSLFLMCRCAAASALFAPRGSIEGTVKLFTWRKCTVRSPPCSSHRGAYKLECLYTAALSRTQSLFLQFQQFHLLHSML